MHIRLIGLGIAGLFILVVVLAGLQKRRQQKRFQMSAGELGVLDQPDDSVLGTRRSGSKANLELDPLSSNDSFVDVSSQTQPSQSAQPNRVTTGLTIIHLKARPGTQFAGYELLQALLSTGMRYGEMSIFHRHENANGKGPVLFSSASATEPGVFDIKKMGNFACNGLSFFMRHSGDLDRDDAVYDLMIQTAEKIGQDLRGDLYDAEHQPLDTAVVV